jgi:hypothetical protein
MRSPSVVHNEGDSKVWQKHCGEVSGMLVAALWVCLIFIGVSSMIAYEDKLAQDRKIAELKGQVTRLQEPQTSRSSAPESR